MKNKKSKTKPKPKKVSFGVGGASANTLIPNVRRSAMNKVVEPKPNKQIMGFNGSMVTK
jgi:hypothetical protein